MRMTLPVNEESSEILKMLLQYDPETGLFLWKERPLSLFTHKRYHRAWNVRFANQPALINTTSGGYKNGSIFGRLFLAHRVAWAISYDEWPENIDHINRIRDDNRLVNLRASSRKENAKNKSLPSNNKSGHSGIFWLDRLNKWCVTIGNGKTNKYIGSFSNKEEAINARREAENEFGYY